MRRQNVKVRTRTFEALIEMLRDGAGHDVDDLKGATRFPGDWVLGWTAGVRRPAGWLEREAVARGRLNGGPVCSSQLHDGDQLVTAR